MADMTKIIGATIAIAVSVIVIATVLAPTIAEYTAEGQALASYSSLLSAIIILTVVGVMMVAVKLVASRN